MYINIGSGAVTSVSLSFCLALCCAVSLAALLWFPPLRIRTGSAVAQEISLGEMETCDLQDQAMATHLLEEVFACSNSLPTVPAPQAQPQQPQQQERRPRPQPEQALRCPRCDSTNTKFCYYNNYSLSQPRYFCKGCRRYWTKGGTLRNVPVGGGCRKNKRPSSSSSKKAQDHQTLAACSTAVLQALPPPPPLTYDLTLAFAGLIQKPPTTSPRQLALDDRDPFMLESSGANPIPPLVPGFLDILRSGFLDSSSASTFDNLYYGHGGHGNTQGGEGGVGGGQVVPPFEGLGGGATAAIKHECSYKSVDEDKQLFMGLQWQTGGDGNMMVDPAGRDYWNGVGSSWHGLVHSSLI